ncbi:MAG: 5'/3'-nucleotidase SurE, partial [Chloroflexota bacterium]|nr:5'/3'-nucleotidase SurE [Chloroflexota bacterium]
MTDNERPLILLTNDDGIRSPALWAAAEALSEIGFVTVAAPREQSSGAGRSMPVTSDGSLLEEQVNVRGKNWKVYAVGGSPAQAVQHGILELMPRRPDLVVAGINYGENLTTGVTVSGTVGAALEGASFGVPALAVSLEVPPEFYFSYSDTIDFRAAMYFTAYFARVLIGMNPMTDVDVLKVDIPSDASETTEWRMTRLSRQKYYVPVVTPRARLE